MRKKGEQKPIEVTCVFSGEEQLEELPMRSFDLFVRREVAKKRIDVM